MYLVVFALTAVSEEGALRGYGLVQLSRAISFWPAAVVMSTLFLALHLVHKNETPIGLAQVGLVGLILAYSFRRSGALWFALGFHASWDYAQSFVFGVPDSGTSLTGALLHPNFHGPSWLTGGTAGPEGSVLVLPILAVLAVVSHLAFPTPRSIS
jgi:membrane protease YdiL (CAAX protease family)